MPEFSFTLGWGDKIRRNKLERQILDHLPQLYRMARGMSDQPSDAEDLVHDTCVKALSTRQEVDLSNRSSFRAYLNRILVNTYRDSYRRKQAAPVRPFEYHSAMDNGQNVVEMVVSDSPSPVESISQNDSTTAIHQAFSSLPPEVRVVSVLFLVSGLSYKNIAEITDCPIGTVMSRLARGRKQLRVELASYHPGESDYPQTSMKGENNESL